MKKIFSLLAVALLSVFLLVSCSKTYMVNFDTDGGSEVVAVEVAEGSTLTLPAAPTKEGLTFGGWYTDPNCVAGSEFDATKPVTGDLYLYAQWVVTLTFNSNGGSAVDTMVNKPSAIYELPADPVKDGFVFAGWYTDEALTTELPKLSFPKVNTTAYAKWLVADATTEYVMDGFKLLDAGSYAITNNEDGSVTYTCVNRELNVQKLCAWEWEAITHSTTGADLVNEDGSLKYTKLVVKVQGTAGENIMFKVNDTGGAYEKKVDLDGTVQDVEVSLEGLNVNAGNTSLVIMAQAGVASAGSNVKISSIYFTNGAEGENLKTLDLLSGTWKNNAANVVVNHYVGTAEYSFGLVELKQNVDGYRVVSARVKGTKGVGVLFKLEGAKDGAWVEKTFTMTGEDQTIEWVVPTENLTRGDSNIKFLFCLTPGTAGASNGAYVTFKSIGVQRLVASGSENKQVAYYFHTNGGSKVDTFFANVGADVTAPEAPTKEGWVFTGWYTDAELKNAYTFGKAPNAAVQLYAGWEKASVDPRTVDMLADTFGTNANITSTVNEDGAWVLKKTAGEWECILSSIKVSDISGMCYLNVQIKGTKGDKILFKIGDTGNPFEKWVECTGEVQNVTFEFDGSTLEANKAALVVFPNGGIAGASNDFVITKLEYSNFVAGDNMLDVAFGTNDNITSTVNENGAWVLKKTAGEWECIASSIKVSDLTGKSVLAVEVKGAAGSKILFKIGDVNACEKWVECTGEVQYVEFEYDHATLPANNAALVIFPNGGINGASEDFVITKLEFTNGVSYLDARTGWVNNDKDAYTITEGAGSVTIKKNDSWVNAENATCGTEWCFVKNEFDVVDGKYTTLVVKFTSDAADQEYIFNFNNKEVKPFTNAGEQEIEIVLDAPITKAELKIFANAGKIGSCTLVITDMYLK